MKTVTIRLTMMTDNVKNFVRLVNRYPYDMDLRSGRYVVDAKSIMGIFSLDLTQPMELRARATLAKAAAAGIQFGGEAT